MQIPNYLSNFHISVNSQCVSVHMRGHTCAKMCTFWYTRFVLPVI